MKNKSEIRNYAVLIFFFLFLFTIIEMATTVTTCTIKRFFSSTHFPFFKKKRIKEN